MDLKKFDFYVFFYYISCCTLLYNMMVLLLIHCFFELTTMYNNTQHHLRTVALVTVPTLYLCSSLGCVFPMLCHSIYHVVDHVLLPLQDFLIHRPFVYILTPIKKYTKYHLLFLRIFNSILKMKCNSINRIGKAYALAHIVFRTIDDFYLSYTLLSTPAITPTLICALR